jgi:hypothetical protein
MHTFLNPHEDRFLTPREKTQEHVFNKPAIIHIEPFFPDSAPQRRRATGP